MNSNPRTVFVLGAGASREAGGPLMRDFIDIAEGISRAPDLSTEDRSLFDAVFKGIAKLQLVLSKSILDLGNLESVFAAFEMAELLGSPLASVDGVSLTAAIRRMIVVTLERRIACQVSEQQAMPHESFVQFAEMAHKLQADEGRAVTVITFNYDIGIEQGLAWVDMPLDYCLSEGTRGSCLRMLKLHGSMNWALCTKCNTVVPWHWDDFMRHFMSNRRFRHGGGKAPFCPPIASSLSQLEHCALPVGPNPVMVPPTWSKGEHHRVIQPVWRQAASDLAEAENIVVMGYSFPESDAFFHHLFAVGSASDVRIKKFLVFDPDTTGDVAVRFRALLGPTAQQRFNSYKYLFSRAVSELPNILAAS